MNILIWMILLVLVLLTFFPRPGVGRFKTFVLEAHPYSGLDPHEWKLFLTELNAFDADPSKTVHLYAAIDHLRNLGLMNTNYTEAINEISDRLGYEGELVAKVKTPKYLNDIISKAPLDDFRVGAAIGRGFPDPRSHGQ